ncbi:hypothetical protein GCM10008101_13170 [Lysobacter xinjiangensis]|uniref:Protease inhibitor Inh n=1 Tax=Cognatilysobacter xinjiangensis TaxID=546892 RepID=A0ABQ3BXX8_9GAMM|nr:hypothetical protein [Lysobacter xinjiangensis]GGZ60591.1 hypothetical protein GCM10008101_13170 [Lysobacter xinjiangensis]
MRLSAVAAFALVPLLAGCGRTDAPDASTDAARPPAAPAVAPPAVAAPSWRLASGSEGTSLAVENASGRTLLRAWCKSGEDRLRVNVPDFAAIASEERMSFGQGGEVMALVADAAGDAARGGVSAETPVPSNLRTLLSGAVTATYGAQISGPHPVPPPALVSDFVVACASRGANADGDAITDGHASASPRASACLVQDGQPVPANRVRAVGTEPFWSAQVDGRCVTYSHPDDRDGTRVWTRFSGTPEAGTWSGALDGKPFVMRTRAQKDCSDGMSDRRYPLAVSLTVGGEQRSGCAFLQ